MARDEDADRAAMQRLDPLVGEWTVGAEFPAGPLTGVAGRVAFERTLDDRFLIERFDIAHPDFPHGIAVIGPAADGDGYRQHYFDSRGVVRIYAMTFEHGVWTLLRDKPDFTPLTFAQRFTGTFDASGDAIRGRWETDADGSGWRLDFELNYERVSSSDDP